MTQNFALWTQIILSIIAIILLLPFAGLCLVLMGFLSRKNEEKKDPDVRQFKIINRSRRYQETKDKALEAILSKQDLKSFEKMKKLQKKQKTEKEKRLYVLTFTGDVAASHVGRLRDSITLILNLYREGDEVLLNLDSPGGAVTGYGLAGAELTRLRKHQIPFTVCVDKVAASGGYMMACVANKIVASPFAIVGSIGVVAGMPNIHRYLEKHQVDYLEMTAGEFKRTLTPLGEITDKKKEKFQSQLDMIHVSFKEFVKEWRPQLDIEQVATGDYWVARQALHLKLVDVISTSEEYILEKANVFEILEVKALAHEPPLKKLMHSMSAFSQRFMGRPQEIFRFE